MADGAWLLLPLLFPAIDEEMRRRAAAILGICAGPTALSSIHHFSQVFRIKGRVNRLLKFIAGVDGIPLIFLLGLAASLAVGAVLGFLLILYLARVNKEVALFLLAIVVMAIELVALVETRLRFHLHFLLVFIAAGFVVENASAKGDLLIQGLERSSLPIYVIFFTFSGVGLDLDSLRLLWPLAFAFVVWRGFLLYVSTYAGASLAGENTPAKRFSWTAFVAQAGRSLGLAELVAQQFPHMGPQIRTFVLAVVAINQLVGPVLFGWALRRVDEDGRANAQG